MTPRTAETEHNILEATKLLSTEGLSLRFPAQTRLVVWRKSSQWSQLRKGAIWVWF